MKKFLSITLVLAMMCVLGACGSSKDNAAEATTEAASSAEVVPVELNASEYVELGEYKGLTIEAASTEVTDEEVDEEVALLAEDYVEYKEVKDRSTVEDGDYVNIDYTCTIDGEVNDDYSDTEIDTQIGSEEYKFGDDFDMETKLIGAEVGKPVTMELTFPEDFDDDTVAGKACTMEVTVNSIEEEVVPELTDEFIKENTDCSTLEEYKEQTRKELEESYASEAEETNQDNLWSTIVDNCTQLKDFSDEMIAQEISNLTIENEEYAGYFGMTAEEFIEEYYGMTMEEAAKTTLLNQCVQDLLIEAEGIEVTEEEYQEELQSYVDEAGYESEEEVLEYYTEDEIKEDLLYTKLMTTLMSYTTVTEETE